MTDREDRLRSLLDRVRAKRPVERETHAAETIERIRTASGTTAAAPSSVPARPQPIPSSARPEPVPSSFPTQLPSSPLPDPPTSPGLESPTRYSSQPPQVERPLSSQPRAGSSRPSGPAASAPPRSGRPQPIRPQSVAPSGQPVVFATDQPEFPRAKTFGELLELTLSLRPR